MVLHHRDKNKTYNADKSAFGPQYCMNCLWSQTQFFEFGQWNLEYFSLKMYQELVYILSGLGILFYVFMTWNFEYWKKRKVPGPPPRFLLGNLPSFVTQKEFVAYEVDRLYKWVHQIEGVIFRITQMTLVVYWREFKNRFGFIGFLNARSPNVLIINPELVKEILIKNFRSFSDNTFANFADKESDPIFGRNPFMLKGTEWKEKRAEITPAFTVSRVSWTNLERCSRSALTKFPF